MYKILSKEGILFLHQSLISDTLIHFLPGCFIHVWTGVGVLPFQCLSVVSTCYILLYKVFVSIFFFPASQSGQNPLENYLGYEVTKGYWNDTSYSFIL